ncbi:MAG: acyl-CoA carboxylase subunit beta [Planctomycetales bacterium]
MADSRRAAQTAPSPELWQPLLQEFREQRALIAQGGGKKAIDRQHEKGRLTARERIAKLIDPGTDFMELGLWAAWKMYEEWGGAPSAGVVCGVGQVSGRTCLIAANDATVKAGAFFPMSAKKLLRAQRIAMENRLPLIYLVDSAGVFLPLQDEVFPDEDDFGRIFRNNSVISAQGIPQLAAIMGHCVAGGGYLPVLCDKSLITEGSGLYLAGPALVKSAIGQVATSEELGGAEMHTQISGTVDFREPNDDSCLERIRSLVSSYAPDTQAECYRPSPSAEPAIPTAEIYNHISPHSQAQYEIRKILECLVDADSFQEYRTDYGKTLICGYARLGGYRVGILANQHHPEKTPHGLEFGGVIYRESAEKGARFIMDCNQNWLPIIFLQDVNGFMVGKESEQGGIIRAGAKMVNVISNSRVPKLTVIIGGSFGAGNYAMCGKAFDPRLIYAWPNAQCAVMGGTQAASTLLEVQISALKRQGKTPDAEELQELRKQTEASYKEKTDIRYSGARGWVDDIIEPDQTRKVLIESLKLTTRAVGAIDFKTGVLQV